jgi:small ligand-binding sensory domain FIST
LERNVTRRIEFASATSRERGFREAVRELAASVEQQIGLDDIDLVMMFVSPHFAQRADQVSREAQLALRPRTFMGCAGEGVIGDGEEIESGPAAALIAARLPGSSIEARAFHPTDTQTTPRGLRTLFEADGAPDAASLIVVIADPFSADVDRLLATFDAVCPGVPIAGGMASAVRAPGGNALFHQKDVHRYGSVVASISGAIDVDVIVSQGCRPIGRPCRVTAARGNMVLRIEDALPLDELKRIVEELPPDDRQLLRNGIFLGRAVDPQKEMLGRGDFLIRAVVGVDPRIGAITAGDFFTPGEMVQFHLRDARTATEDLEMMLSPQTLFGPPRGALLFSCNGRGTRLYERPNGDISVIHRAFPGLSLAGFFCAGEIGPIGPRSFLHGHTATLALFRARRPA